MNVTWKYARSVAQCAALLLVLSSLAHAGAVSVSAPTSGQAVSSPIHVVASGSSTNTVTAMQVYVDSVLAVTVSGAKLDANVNAASGTHKLTIKGWDATGATFAAIVYVNVSSTTATSTPSATYSAIEHSNGWQSCGACAGPNGAGPTVPYSMKQGTASPSLDGAASEFWLGGTTPYASALWWKQLGANAGASNFVYDLYFYLKSPNVAQALEFDVNQSVGGLKYIFGTECSVKSTQTWRVWGQAGSWINTGIPCPVPTAYTWHHLTLEFKRTDTKQVSFVSVTLDGKKSYINRAFTPQVTSAKELNVAFQMDGDYREDNYSTWVDKISLSAW